MGLEKIRHRDYEQGRFSLTFLKDKNTDFMLELTHNWDQTEDYSFGKNFGHFAFIVDDIYAFCEKLMDNEILINRPPLDGHMAFFKDPDNISIEILQSGEALPVKEPWASMPKIGSW